MATAPTKRKPTATKTTASKATSTTARKPATTKGTAPARKRAPAKPKTEAPVPTKQETETLDPTPTPAVPEHTPVPPAPRRIPTLAELVAVVASSNADKAIAVTKRENDIALHAAGEIGLPESIVMVGSLLSALYSQLTGEEKVALPVNAFLNQVATVATRRILVACPDAPIYYEMVKKDDESQPANTDSNSKA